MICLHWKQTALLVLCIFSYTGFLVFKNQYYTPINLGKVKRRENDTPKKRNILFIVGHGRVGSTLLGELFNQHEQFLYFYEPLRSLEFELGYANMGNKDPVKAEYYRKEVKEFIKDMMTCNYRKRHDKYLQRFEQANHRYRSKKLTYPPNCDRNKTCHLLNSTFMNKLCKNGSFENIVLKILTSRLPHADIALFMENLSRYTTVSILHLVRDPRSYLHSMKQLMWFGDGYDYRHLEKREDFYMAERCFETTRNLEYALRSVRNADKRMVRFSLLRYEDINMRNIKNLSHGLSRLLDKDIFNHTYSYFVRKINGKANAKNVDAYLTQSRNIASVDKKWREQVDYEFVRKIQYICYDVMQALGYNMVSDEKTLRTTSKVLYGDLRLKELDVIKYHDFEN